MRASVPGNLDPGRFDPLLCRKEDTMTQLKEAPWPIDDVREAHERMLRPENISDRITYIQVRALEARDLLRGMAAAADQVGPKKDILGVEFSLIQEDGLWQTVTIVVQDRDDDGWQVADDSSYAVRVTTAR
jgi:hypothetical protein